jgi:hypothetical protein
MFLPKAIRVFSIVSFLLCLPASHAQIPVETLTNTNLDTADLASVPAQPALELFRVIGPLPSCSVYQTSLAKGAQLTTDRRDCSLRSDGQ